MEYVLAPEDIVWKEFENPASPGIGFGFTPSVIDEEYTEVYSAQLGKIGPGGRSKPHVDHYNHAFYFISGQGDVTIGKRTWPLVPGTVVRIPSGLTHGFTNTGTEDLTFFVVYDPPYVAGGPFEAK
ncbi:cupin domain-containing protein [Kribbella sp. NPDC051620]|uniref:cupin domain-containing protein n=1 Tax=Kribbella sp. NPDC051620 TaxID=3364120 RepID=UPI0037A65AB3